MYITGQHRYDNYTSRMDVYLFTLRDYTEVLLDKFGGSILERSDMPTHGGYLLKFINVDKATDFIEAISTSHTTEDPITTYVLPHLEGNEFPIYATTAEDTDVVYIGLSEYKEALDDFIGKVFKVEFDANGGTGTMQADNAVAGSTIIIPANGFTAPEDKEFKEWNTAADGSGNVLEAGDTFVVTESVKFYAQWVNAE